MADYLYEINYLPEQEASSFSSQITVEQLQDKALSWAHGSVSYNFPR